MARSQDITASQDVMRLVARKYTLRIIALLDANGPMRYTELQDALGATSTSTLADHLGDLADAGLVERRSYDEVPPHVEYTLTQRGRELGASLEPLLAWTAAT